MKTYTLSEKTINDILGYLGHCPYQEMITLIPQIQEELKPQLAPKETPPAEIPPVEEATPTEVQ